MSASNEPDLDPDELAGSELDQSLPERQIPERDQNDEDEEDEYITEDDDLQSISPPEPSRKALNRTAASDSLARASDRAVPALTQIPFAQDPSYLTRLNRWHGPDSTWLSWTEEDRLAVRSLDRIRSQDLSLHLYNAYSLNANAKHSKGARSKVLKGKAPVRSIQGLDDDPAETLQPPRGWTAWPLPPDQVPREHLFPEIDPVSVRRTQDDLRHSARLEDCLIATTTRLARKRWKDRSWQPEFAQQRDWNIKIEEGEQDVAMEESLEASSEEPDAAETNVSDSESTSDDAGGTFYTSQAYDLVLDDAEIEGSKEPKPFPTSPPSQRPVPIADDEIAKGLLLPGTRSTLAKLDDLLMGLHKARQAYTSASSRRGRDRGLADDSAVTTDMESESTTVKTSGRKRKRKRAVSVMSARSTGSDSIASDDPQKESAQRRKPNPRNWSDVIGMAALTGWDPAVVARASQRCANLFSENMLFRTFHEGDRSKQQFSYYTEYEALEAEDLSESETRNDSSVAVVRTSQACEECHNNKEKCEARDGAEGNGSCKRCSKLRLACSGVTVKIYNDISRVCPYKDCERHSIPFRNAGHLQRHIDSVHQHDVLRPQQRTQSLVQAQSTEIVCPIPTCQRHKQPFSRGGKLYDHIRKMHPEIDIQEIKKLESARRGDKRGRYRDESRRREIGRANRSRSKSVASRGESEG